MAKRIENDCVSCDIPCIDCGRKRTPHYYCDKCGEEFEPEALFINEDEEELCIECFLSKYETVAQRER